MRLSQHFHLSEFTRSQTASRLGIDNRVPDEILPALKRTAEGLELVRVIVGAPIVISSGYRSPLLNRVIRGANNSQHTLGQAADINAVGLSPDTLAKLLDQHRLEIRFDQLILEYPPDGWVHISFTDEHPRMIALTKTRADGYVRGIQA